MADSRPPSSVRSAVVGFADRDTDPRRGERRALVARGATWALAFGLLACIAQVAATAIPTWAYFHNPDAGTATETGYFGPWRQCKYLLYGRERCGQGVTRLKPLWTVWMAGVAAAGASVLLGLILVLSVLQLAMASSAKRIVVSYSVAVIGKVALATLATCLAIAAASLFATQTDDRDNSFIVTRGEGFYLQVVSIVLNFGVLVSAIYEGIYARRGGDPTRLGRNHYSEHRGATFSNPGYRENRHSNNGELAATAAAARSDVGGGISMTDASGKPYVGGGRSQHGNGSMASVATSGISVVSSVGSPLRSSLKKPKPLGIQNPGFSSTSPQLQRNGSQKKVRIQTHSTEV
ncbi:uncharacterized protein LOC106650594 isoform X2 [Trichogramma pretiosum]|uniref:uncharacterized protein LOC106650594 isoform X2 n=1 Tax=Trichogramma pretiosum TaxID=7493 RepID=UPI000C71BBDD|nr:uncharacterized protein LOC106650594 isoform X2 [Trichogramma pretiosum]